jgi:ATP-dependent Lon protease
VQNHAFRDTYLDLEYDISPVLFIATANYEEDIPETLHDRLEVIRLSGYTSHEKEQIARRHLIPRLAAESGLPDVGDVLTRPALRFLIEAYTREAGVRELNRNLGKLYRKLARARVEGRPLPARVGPKEVERLLLSPPFLKARLEDIPLIGVSTGLAYTGAGGDILRIEAVVAPGKGDFHLTGQLGEVMQESVTAAWGYLKTAIMRDRDIGGLWDTSPGRAYLAEHFSPPETPMMADPRGADPDGPDGLLIEPALESPPTATPATKGSEFDVGPTDHELLSGLEVRMHLPEGAVPKEGPSAGIAVAASLFSALTHYPLAPRIALSGEITLTGHVLAVGGLKEKILAARREGVVTVILPEDVRPQIRELPVELLRGLDVVYVSTFPEVIAHVLITTTEGREEQA